MRYNWKYTGHKVGDDEWTIPYGMFRLGPAPQPDSVLSEDGLSDFDFEKFTETLRKYMEIHFGESQETASISVLEAKPFDKTELRAVCESGVSLISCYARDTRIKITPSHKGYKMYVLMYYYSAELELFFSSVDDMITNIDRLVGDKGIWSYND